jgi:hypothetical protein
VLDLYAARPPRTMPVVRFGEARTPIDISIYDLLVDPDVDF